MDEMISSAEVAAMRPINRSPQLLNALSKAYHNGTSGSEKVSRNYHLRKEQDEMIEDLAGMYDETKVAVLRTIIDEWREMKLRGCDEE